MRTKWIRITVLVLLFALFGFLMAIRQEVPGIWLRAGIAAIAGAILGLTIALAMRSRK